jgi:hypothetical protein
LRLRNFLGSRVCSCSRGWWCPAFQVGSMVFLGFAGARGGANHGVHDAGVRIETKYEGFGGCSRREWCPT